MKNSQPTAENYTPERGDVFEWYGRCYICIDGGGSSGTVVQIGQNYHIKDFGGGSSGTVVQIGQNYHIKDFTWMFDDISPVFISKATEQEMEMYFGEQPETPASSAGNILTDELTIEQQGFFYFSKLHNMINKLSKKIHAANKEMKNSQSTAENYTPERGDVFEWYGRYVPERGDVFEWCGRCYICIDGGGSSGTVVQIGQDHHIKGFEWRIHDTISVFVRKATEQEMEMYFGEQPETPASSSGNILTDELTIEQQAEVLDKLFGFYFVGGILMDGRKEFYSIPGNLKFDMTTIGGIILYIRHTEYRKGYEACQGDMRKALGI